MLSFTKKIAIVTSLVASCSEQFAAFGSDINNNNNVVVDEDKRPIVAFVDTSREVAEESSFRDHPRFGILNRVIHAPSKIAARLRKLAGVKKLARVQASAQSPLEHVTQRHLTLGHVNKDNKVQIFTLVAGDGKTNPGDLRLVCREWRHIIDGLIKGEFAQKPAYASLHPIWKSLVKATYVGLGNDAFCETFAKLRLIYHPLPLTSKEVILPFSGLKNPFCGTFNLAELGDSAQDIRFTTSLKDFFEIGGSKGHVLFATKAMFAQTMKTMKMPDDLKAKLNEIMNKWDNSLAPVGIFWRLSDDNNLTLFDYLVTQDLPSISAHNLFGNWQKAQGQGYSGAFCWTNFHVRI